MQQLPVRHILFEEKWEAYTKAYEALHKKLQEKKVDSSLLDECLEATFELADLSADESFVSGYEKGRLNGIKSRTTKVSSQVV